jgi:glycosyltransferase involved in cell wall biosynthesis
VVIIAAMNSPAHIALNAHLLSGEASYRSAGIHGYLYHTLACLPDVDPAFRYTAFVGAGQPSVSERMQVLRSHLPTQNPLARIVWEQFVAPLALMRLRPDLLHGMAFAVPLLWGGPSVVTIFDLSFLRYPERLGRARRLYLGWATRISTARARRVIAISESAKREISAMMGVPESRIDVAVPGVSDRFKPFDRSEIEAFRRAHGLPDRFILYLGTIEPRKNLDTLLRAYASLPQRREVKLMLAGGQGWQTEQIFALMEQLGLKEDVLLPGYIPGDELPLWYNAAEMFAYPSIYEGFGIPVLEAMACGVPVVASDTTSLPEVVGTAGVLVPATSVEAWSDALASLLAHEVERADLAQLGQAHARSFTWHNTARQTAESYRRALKASS